MTRRDVIGLVTVLILTTPVAVTVWAAPPPSQSLRGAVEQAVRIVEDPDFKRPARQAERRAALRRVATEIFDFQEITKRALGLHWQARTPAEREEIVRLVASLLERAYISKIEHYSGERITYTSEAVDGDLATVRTRIVTRQGTDIPVEYRMVLRGERWLAYDVIIEGVSLVANYRGQFNKILQSSSYAELVRRLRTKLEADEPDPRSRRAAE